MVDGGVRLTQDAPVKATAYVPPAPAAAKGAQANVVGDNDKPTVIALREIAERKVDQALIDEIDKQEREKKEREALEWAAAEVDDDLSKGGDDL